MDWLKTDALNRTWRTVLQGAAATVVTAVIAAAIEVIQAAVASGNFDPSVVGQDVIGTARTAALIALLAYLHRRFVDPSKVPSATPPAPPISELGK